MRAEEKIKRTRGYFSAITESKPRLKQQRIVLSRGIFDPYLRTAVL